MKKVLTNLDAVMIAEGVTPCEDRDLYYAAWQHLIDQGLHLTLQGWYGRAAKTLIKAGLCREPNK
jgi:hypothetical protein